MENVDIDAALDRPITDFALSVRAHSLLKANNINTLRDLIKYKPVDLLKFHRFGKKTLSELKDLVDFHGLEWGTPSDKGCIEPKIEHHFHDRLTPQAMEAIVTYRMRITYNARYAMNKHMAETHIHYYAVPNGQILVDLADTLINHSLDIECIEITKQ